MNLCRRLDLEIIVKIVGQILEVEFSDGDLDRQLSEFGWDSLAALQFIVTAKNELGLNLTGEQVAALKTLSDVCRFLEDR